MRPLSVLVSVAAFAQLALLAPAHASPPAPVIVNEPGAQASDPWARAFLERARPVVDAHPGRVLLHARDLRTGRSVGLNDDVPGYLASGVKLLIMVELMRLHSLGALKWDEKIRYGIDDVRDGAPKMNKRQPGTYVPLRTLLVYAVRDSDNAAADLLWKRIDVHAMKTWLDERGFRGVGPIVPLLDIRIDTYTRLDPRAATLHAAAVRDVGWHPGFEPRLDLLKKHLGPPFGTYDRTDLDRVFDEYYALGRNSAPMRTMADMLAALADGELISPEADHEMIALLRKVWTSHRRVDRFIDPGTVVAHKTGTQHRRVVDLALIETNDGGRMVFAIVVEGGKRVAAEEVVARLARLFIEHVQRTSGGTSAPPSK